MPDSVRAAITDLERTRWEAVVAGDIEAAASLCHPLFRYTHATGGRPGPPPGRSLVRPQSVVGPQSVVRLSA